ncbi:NAD(P)H dehydrogenase (quinone) [Asanoa hainanensis]|uniref:NAD(P)H dehydrogenase (Quinone) n=1 Tax=Asanoa hainanensis TaxID=560556 RepID=A0A239M4J9_9ACTN|nr:NAD(P)H-binding protein [Asanoa hainanensis]SNT36849.1 NAD(P)H dehydrogenase (quinone) [Asanoa hainanensis]
MIVVCAASGALGRLVVAELVARGSRVVAAVRDPAVDLVGAEVRHGDYDDPVSLRSALSGAERVLLISSPELATDRRVAQHRAVIDAAVAEGVRAVAYTSFLGADRGGDPMNAAHHETERALVASGLGHTILRHPFYTDAFVNAAVVGSGVLLSATGGRGLNTALRADLAEAAVNVLTDDSHLGRAYDLTGPPWTYQQLAEVLREAGRPVEHRDSPDAVQGPMGFLMGLARAGRLERQTDDLRRVLGREPATLRQVVERFL